ncbi:MAG: cytochrome c nitrite reductase small subunit [Deltaproteobacteria bacterium]|nr:cytochrome c nitrite reductase small subunit [Deltaproteobacteria bacterium]
MRNSSKVILTVSIGIGVLIGGAIYLFWYAKGYSYLSHDSKACLNCHVMREQFNSWTQASHHIVAQCNDCHLSGNILSQMKTKILNGFSHSLAFTLQNFHEPIQIKKRNRKVVESSCQNCHTPLLEASGIHGRKDMSCLGCHRQVGHLQ